MNELDYESSVIGALCKSPAARKQYLDKIEKDDFLIRTHAQVFEAILSLSQGGHHVSMDSVLAFFSELTDRMAVTFLFDVKVAHELTPEIYTAFKKGGVRSRLIKLKDYVDKELRRGGDPEHITETVRQMVTSLEGQDAAIEVSDMDNTADSAIHMLDEWSKGEQPVISGLPELDNNLFLSQFIGYWILAGISGAGKSALMCNIAKENARRGVPGTICSLEMSKNLLLMRMAMEDPKIRGLQLTERTVKDVKKMSDLKYAMDSFRKLPIYIVEGVPSIFRLDKISRKLAIDKGCRWTLFDYIQLGKTKPTDSDVIRVYTVSRYLQGLTEPDLPNGYRGQAVIALSQYNNEATKSRNEVTTENNGFGQKQRRVIKPTNADLAWSGQIKQDADGILHLHTVGDLESAVLDIEIHCGKQRNYVSGWTVPAKFIKAEQRFETDLSMRKGIPGVLPSVPIERDVQF